MVTNEMTNSTWWHTHAVLALGKFRKSVGLRPAWATFGVQDWSELQGKTKSNKTTYFQLTSMGGGGRDLWSGNVPLAEGRLPNVIKTKQKTTTKQTSSP